MIGSPYHIDSLLQALFRMRRGLMKWALATFYDAVAIDSYLGVTGPTIFPNRRGLLCATLRGFPYIARAGVVADAIGSNPIGWAAQAGC